MATWVSDPFRKARHIWSRSSSLRLRAGGVNLRSGPRSSTSDSSSARYCGHASAAASAPQLRAVCTASTASMWLTWAKVIAAPVAAASAPTMVSAESSALRLRHSTSRPGSSRPARRSDHSAMEVIVSSSQCTSARPSTLANAVRAASNSEAESPGTPWVVQVNSLKKTTPAPHSSGMPPMSSGQTWAASP